MLMIIRVSLGLADWEHGSHYQKHVGRLDRGLGNLHGFVNLGQNRKLKVRMHNFEGQVKPE